MPKFQLFKIDKHGRSMYRRDGNSNTTLRCGASQFAGTPPDEIEFDAVNLAPTGGVKLTKEERKAQRDAIPADVRKAARAAAKEAAAKILAAAGIGA